MRHLFQIVGSFLTFTFHKVVYRREQGVMASLMINSLHNHCWVRGWKNWNQSTFAEVIGN